MTFKQTSEALAKALGDKQNKVILLTGLWGTGKTTLVHQVLKGLNDPPCEPVLWASLFGHKSLDQVKLAIMQDVVPSISKNPGKLESARSAARVLKTFAEGFSKSFSALGDVWQILLPSVVKGRLLVLDDIERKHQDIGIDEILGFVESATEHFGARCLLIMNVDKVKDTSDEWDELKERVIDETLHLNTTPAEAFEIATEGREFSWANIAKNAVVTCEITNIRILSKVIQTIDKILVDQKNISPAVAHRVIPSTVLLVGIDRKGIQDAPTFEYVLGFNEEVAMVAGFYSNSDQDSVEINEPEIDRNRMEARWNRLLSQLGIHSIDEFESTLINYLQIGALDQATINPIIQSYVQEERIAEVRNTFDELVETLTWKPSINNAELLLIAEKLVPNSQLLDPYMVTYLHRIMQNISGDSTRGNQAVENWISAHENDVIDANRLNTSTSQALHENFQKFFNRKLNTAMISLSLLEACKMIGAKKVTSDVMAVLVNATSEQFEKLLSDCSDSDFKMILTNMLELVNHMSGYEMMHVVAANFLQACAQITQTKPDERIATVLKIQFENSRSLNLLRANTIDELRKKSRSVSAILAEAVVGRGVESGLP